MTNSSPFTPGNCAVITGGASGIGLAAAKLFAAMGLNVVVADMPGVRLDAAAREVAAASPNGAKGVLAAPTDVSQLAEVEALEKAATSAFGPVAVLMNNAGIGPGSSRSAAAGTPGGASLTSTCGGSSTAAACSRRA